MKIRPLQDRLLVRRLEGEEKTAGGIIIPDTAKEKPQEAEVVAAGDGKLDDNGKAIAMSVKKGDKVLMPKYGGTEIKIDDVEHVILREDSREVPKPDLATARPEIEAEIRQEHVAQMVRDIRAKADIEVKGPGGEQ